ncbi:MULTISPECIES: hypothetical protein [Wolbachia]|uniref:hypothetical protein n=1 Tax=Wolbachia TaxID=953 RepID=UPI0010208BBB|nr:MULTISPECIES: hypothetical protein [Wolbachia]UYC23122.1 hypothetical protein L3551_04275 [Wolbachia endosymbiont of Aedes aegypti]QDW08232.1 hypothetical protein CO539_000805 [Wolbachia pipientis]QDW09420.1 hypothetical protein CO538_000805 [Wolbachia pipientis]QZA83620.1 hypothetical protein K1Y75_00775 [Wolbachia pipientis]THA20335.1 hypothetical protein EJE47_01860 [Wolbachia endosymbiont of Aedes albopictus]
MSIHEFADAREKLHRLSIVLQDIIRNREGMLATGSYFYDNNYSSSSKIKKALQLDEHQLYSFIDVDDSEKLRS